MFFAGLQFASSQIWQHLLNIIHVCDASHVDTIKLDV